MANTSFENNSDAQIGSKECSERRIFEKDRPFEKKRLTTTGSPF